MQTFTDISALRSYVSRIKSSGKRLAFVPTMGALHDGHMALINHAKSISECVIVSIFVNRAQFAPHEDFSKYPRPIDTDITQLQSHGVDAVFLPTEATLYPNAISASTRVYVPRLGKMWDGASRRHYFRGICMVVTRLLNCVQPDVMVMGEKDFQQLHIIQRMVADLFIPTQVVGVPTVRQSNGLALSSRNQYLAPDQQDAASIIYTAMSEGAKMAKSGHHAAAIITHVKQRISHSISAQFDYCAIIRPDSLKPVKILRPSDRLILALFYEKTRLIDNLQMC